MKTRAVIVKHMPLLAALRPATGFAGAEHVWHAMYFDTAPKKPGSGKILCAVAAGGVQMGY
jgi:hypothetical protein